MSTSTSESGFPTFPDGDVTIVVSSSHIYRLHSRILRQAEYFRNIFDTSVAPKLTAQARREGNTPYRFVLMYIEDLPDDQKYQFASLDISESGRSRSTPPPTRVSSIDLSGIDEDRYWDWLFGSFYGISADIDESTFGTTLQDCCALLDVADVVRADLRREVDLTLMRQDETLWKSVANGPLRWSELGRRIQSPTIFREAVIHIIGKWKMLDPEDRDTLATDVYKLCQRKWNELELAKRAIEIRIAGHYPAFLCRNHADKPHRTAYSNDIYMWMALAYFRQYISQSGNDGKNRLASDGGYKWYKAIHDGGSAYLDHDSMRHFHSFFPMSSKAVGVMEQHMNVLKEDVKIFVKDLMINRTHIDPATLAEHEPWLTCAVIDDEDLPWKVSRGLNTAEVAFSVIEDDADLEDN